MLSELEKIEILNDFPNVKLSYENIVHNKVYDTDMYLAIPEGRKSFLWFSYYKNNATCFLLELGEKKEILNIKIKNACFDYKLSYCTILYGTSFYHLGLNCFTMEDIFYYKGKNVSTHNWKNKMELFEKIVQNDMRQLAYNNTFLMIGLPLIYDKMETLKRNLDKIKYKINCIQMRDYHKRNVSYFIPYHLLNEKKMLSPMKKEISKVTQVKTQNKFSLETTSKREKVFKVRPDIQNDIYHLYSLNDVNEYVEFDIAYIPNYTTSVMMNKLFRNIKENSNLDTLEESDDEEEFENEKIDKYVYLDKEYNMICAYNNKFKKWVPLKLA
jgi:hypothetical protein